MEWTGTVDFVVRWFDGYCPFYLFVLSFGQIFTNDKKINSLRLFIFTQ